MKEKNTARHKHTHVQQLTSECFACLTELTY